MAPGKVIERHIHTLIHRRTKAAHEHALLGGETDRRADLDPRIGLRTEHELRCCYNCASTLQGNLPHE